LRQTRIIQPNYAGRFQCVGSTCEDTCCSGWRVSIDDEDYRKLTSVPPGPSQSHPHSRDRHHIRPATALLLWFHSRRNPGVWR